jgi:hypothetical protein
MHGELQQGHASRFFSFPIARAQARASRPLLSYRQGGMRERKRHKRDTSQADGTARNLRLKGSSYKQGFAMQNLGIKLPGCCGATRQKPKLEEPRHNGGLWCWEAFFRHMAILPKDAFIHS